MQSRVELRFQPVSSALSSGPPGVTRILEQMGSEGYVEPHAHSVVEGVKAKPVRAQSRCRPGPQAGTLTPSGAALLQDQT